LKKKERILTSPSPSNAEAAVKEYFRQKATQVEAWLDRLLPAADADPPSIHEAMRYSIFAGGKRLRPSLAIAAGEIFGAAEADLMPAACALEMIHTYSLIHDDLPAMDNDILRRGRPTCHVVYGEALAILAGDALLTQAFRTLADDGPADARVRLQVLSSVAEAAGTVRALIGGQVLDIQHQGRDVDASTLESIHRAKTGALIRCAVRVGALIGGANERELNQLTFYGEKAGLAFQVADDLLDETASSADLGKTAGKDATMRKATYTSLYGIDGARAHAERLCQEAIEALREIPQDTSTLENIARFIVERQS
jgi:geranylgeranyl diphosphate synthase type II